MKSTVFAIVVMGAIGGVASTSATAAETTAKQATEAASTVQATLTTQSIPVTLVSSTSTTQASTTLTPKPASHMAFGNAAGGAGVPIDQSPVDLRGDYTVVIDGREIGKAYGADKRLRFPVQAFASAAKVKLDYTPTKYFFDGKETARDTQLGDNVKYMYLPLRVMAGLTGYDVDVRPCESKVILTKQVTAPHRSNPIVASSGNGLQHVATDTPAHR
jgi:hypothetical protein